MPKYGYRLLALLVGAGILALAGRALLVADSYYVYGSYRAASVPEIAAQEPAYQGSDSCRECHTAAFEKWRAGIHDRRVKCETCHGPARDHAKTQAKLPIPEDTRTLCSVCHEQMPTRPGAQPQIVVADHAGDQQCTVCHNAHSPAIGKATAAGAGNGAALAARCASCHGEKGEGVGSFPPLAGKSAEYLAKRMEGYRSGEIANPMMATIAKGLDDSAIAALADYYAGLGAAAEVPPLAESCASCHGERGEGQGDVPALAGRKAEELAALLKAYRTGERPNPVMHNFAEPLSDETIEALASYYAGLGAGRAQQALPEGAPADAESCAGCHGDRGEGLDEYPPLAGKSAEYLAAQLRAYRSGERQSEVMAGIAEELDDQAIDDLAAWYAAQPAPAAEPAPAGQ